jgi:hypothetical protein
MFFDVFGGIIEESVEPMIHKSTQIFPSIFPTQFTVPRLIVSVHPAGSHIDMSQLPLGDLLDHGGRLDAMQAERLQRHAHECGFVVVFFPTLPLLICLNEVLAIDYTAASIAHGKRSHRHTCF